MKASRNWDLVFERYRDSNLSQSAFCRDEKLSLSSFTYQKSLREGKRPKGQSSSFLELTPRESSSFLELVLSSGVVVRVPSSLSNTRVMELVKCLS